MKVKDATKEVLEMSEKAEQVAADLKAAAERIEAIEKELESVCVEGTEIKEDEG